MKSGRILLLGNNNSSINFADNHYHFRQDSTFLYYFGIDQPGLLGIIDIDNDQDMIFGDELTIDDIVWTGPLPTLNSLAEQVGVSLVHSRDKVINYICVDIHFLPPYRAEHEVLIGHLIGKKVRKVSNEYSIALIKAVVQQRQIKADEELKEIEKAVNITNKMHLEVMKQARPGLREHHLIAVANKVAKDFNVDFSFPPILTIRGEVLHNHYYGNTLNDGDLLLFDGGCESSSHYAGDITRTFPVSHSFSDRQKFLYDIVYQAQQNAVEKAKIGTLFIDVHMEACRTIVNGLKEVNIMTGNTEDALISGAHTMFFQCGLGHMIGLDVHDMENLGEQFVGYTDELIKSTDFGLKSLRLGKTLENRFVVTIEPGIYIIPQLIDLRRDQKLYTDFINYEELDKWRNFGGIRLEDDYVIREDGAQLLGDDLPRTSDEISAVRAKALS